MRKIFALLVLTLGLLIPQAAVALASNVTDATYSGTVRITNNSTATTIVSTNLSLNTQNLIDALLCSSNLSNVALQTNGGADTAFMPARNGTSSWCVYVPTIGEDAYLDYKLYTGGNTSMNGTIRYFPGSGGMTAEDDATMELGDNFTFLWSGFINTANGTGSLADKPSTFWAGTSGNTSGTIGVAIAGANLANATLVPNGDGDETNIPNVTGAATHWQAVLTDDGATSNVYAANFATWYRDLYSMGDFSGGVVSNVTVSAVASSGGAGAQNWIKIAIKTNGTAYESAAITINNPYATVNTSWTTNPSTSLPWTVNDINNLQAGISLTGNAAPAGTAHVTQVYVTVGYSAPLIEATGVTTADHSVNVTADSTNLSISIDGVLADSVALGGVSVPNTANNWTFIQNGAVPYMEYQKLWVGGGLAQHIIWQYTTGNFTDQSGNGNDAAPTYRTDSSDADVSAELLDFGPDDPPEATSGQTGTSQPIAGNMTNIAGMYTELSVTFPLSETFNTLLDAGGVPRALFWFPLLFLTVIGISFLLNIFLKHLFVKAAVAGFLLALFSIMGGFGLWVVFAYLIFAADILIAQKHYSW